MVAVASQLHQAPRLPRCPVLEVPLKGGLRGIDQGQATHDMAGVDAGGGIDAKGDVHRSARASMKASAASQPTVAPRQRARCSTASNERGCGQGRISSR